MTEIKNENLETQDAVENVTAETQVEPTVEETPVGQCRS
jgi:hypothetical protein